MKKSSIVYVPGHTGLLGSAIILELKKKGFLNIITKNHNQLDLTNSSKVDNFFEKENPDVVILTAGRAGNLHKCISNPASLFLLNSLIQNNLFSSSIKYKVEKLVYFGSSCIYPDGISRAIKEKDFLSGYLEQDTKGYAAAKLSGVLACGAINNEYFNNENRFISLIPNTAYGPNDHFDSENSHVFSALIKKFIDAKKMNLKKIILFGSGKPKREFISSYDIANAAIFMLEQDKIMENSHFNIGTGIETSIKELAFMISSKVGYKGQILWDLSKPDGRLNKLLDSSKINNLGWSSSIDIKTGLDLTLNWYEKKYG